MKKNKLNLIRSSIGVHLSIIRVGDEDVDRAIEPPTFSDVPALQSTRESKRNKREKKKKKTDQIG